MKYLNRFCFVLLCFISQQALSQNILLNILTLNSGSVKKNGIVFLEVSITNTSAVKPLAAYKLRPQISFPSALVSVPDTGHVLPPGWKIISNTKGVIWLSNGTDLIPENTTRTILIALRGTNVGGPSTISAALSFSNGIVPGSAIGATTVGDSPADNASTSSIKVIN
jgi:hypothetical protein